MVIDRTKKVVTKARIVRSDSNLKKIGGDEQRRLHRINHHYRFMMAEAERQ